MKSQTTDACHGKGTRQFHSAQFVVAIVMLVSQIAITACSETIYLVTTLAGSPGVSGTTDGTGVVARFNTPRGITVDRDTNVYVADTVNATIRKILPDGTVSTFAGRAGSAGNADGTGSVARFSNWVRGIAVDRSNTIYVADTGNHTIRKITPAGVVSTFAGLAGNYGYADGTGSAAQFNEPNGIDVDSNGNVFVADTKNHTIRKITPSAVVSTLAGRATFSGFADGTGTVARFNAPRGIAVDASNNVYVADTGNGAVRKITPDGMVSSVGGSTLLYGVTVAPNGNVIVTAGNGITTVSGENPFWLGGAQGSSDGTNGAAHFNGVWDVATDGTGNMYVADTGNQTIRRICTVVPGPPTVTNEHPSLITATSTILDATITPNGSTTTAGFEYGLTTAYGSTVAITLSPSDGWLPQVTKTAINGLLPNTTYHYRCASANGHGSATAHDLTFTTVPLMLVTTLAGLAGNSGSTDGTGTVARFSNPQNIAIDAARNVYVADTGCSTIRRITPAGYATTMAGLAYNTGTNDGAGTTARFNSPYDVTVDYSNNVYIADWANSTIRRIVPSGTVSTFAGKPGLVGTTDGAGTVARFNWPQGVASDAFGNTYVADTLNSSLRQITPAGLVTTIAVLSNSYPSCVTVDGGGNMYLADASRHAIFKVTSTGDVSTYAGIPGSPGSEDGVSTAARFYAPKGIAADAVGNIYVADSMNCTIRKITTVGFVTTIAGSPGIQGTADGTNSMARFGRAQGLAVEPDGTVYVADTANGTIRKITPRSLAPFVRTDQAVGTTTKSAVLQGLVNPMALPTTAYFEFGYTSTYGMTTNAGLAPANGAISQRVTVTLTGLPLSTTGTTYHYRLVATNGSGVTFGLDNTFVTLAALPSQITSFIRAETNLVVAISSSDLECTYYVQHCEDLSTDIWEDLLPARHGIGSGMVLTNAADPVMPQQFFRIRVE